MSLRDDRNAALLAGATGSERRLDEVAAAAAAAVEAAWASHAGPWSGADPVALREAIQAIEVCPQTGGDAVDVFRDLGALVLGHGVRVGDPRCAAHLHAPPLLAAAGAELAIAATNQSMDSFDQAPAATFLEDRLIAWLAELLGMPDGATGVLTAGGTASNLHGLLMARDAAMRDAGICAPREQGLPSQSAQWRILASEAAHFSVRRAAGVLGLGAQAVVPVGVDSDFRMDIREFRSVLEKLRKRGEQAIAVVATAGTTDAGAIDPVDAIADIARANDAWLHVDAAVGAGLMMSPRLASRMEGIGHADSVTADFHKLFWQPIATSALLVADAGALSAVREPSAYLDRPEDTGGGGMNLVGRSLDTSRRFDAFKVVLGLRSTGRRRMAALVEHVVELTRQAAEEVAARRDLELLARPQTVTVLFRWRPADRSIDDAALDGANVALQRALFSSGDAIVGRTVLGGHVALKLTLVNPSATMADVRAILDLIIETGAAIQAASR